MAETILKNMLQRNEIEVRSAGVAPHARDGSLVALDVKLALQEDGVSIPEDFRSTALRWHRNLLHRADLILTMTCGQRDRVKEFEEIEGKEMYTLREFAGYEGDIDIVDPSGKDELIEECKEEIKYLLSIAIDKITSQVV
jgi:protein-tyrosine-phosphatase